MGTNSPDTGGATAVETLERLHTKWRGHLECPSCKSTGHINKSSDGSGTRRYQCKNKLRNGTTTCNKSFYSPELAKLLIQQQLVDKAEITKLQDTTSSKLAPKQQTLSQSTRIAAGLTSPESSQSPPVAHDNTTSTIVGDLTNHGTQQISNFFNVLRPDNNTQNSPSTSAAQSTRGRIIEEEDDEASMELDNPKSNILPPLKRAREEKCPSPSNKSIDIPAAIPAWATELMTMVASLKKQIDWLTQENQILKRKLSESTKPGVSQSNPKLPITSVTSTPPPNGQDPMQHTPTEQATSSKSNSEWPSLREIQRNGHQLNKPRTMSKASAARLRAPPPPPKPEHMQRIYIHGIRQMPLRELREELRRNHLYLGRIFNLSFINRSTLEILTTCSYAKVIKDVFEPRFQTDMKYDPTKPADPNASPELAESFKKSFIRRVSTIIDRTPSVIVRKYFTSWLADLGLDNSEVKKPETTLPHDDTTEAMNETNQENALPTAMETE